jgi:hypothetical protein
MSQENKSPITERWWFKLIRLLTVGIFQGLARLLRGFGGLSKKAKLGIVGGFVALLIVGGIVGQQETKKAQELGFVSVAEMRKAEKAGFVDKASWSKHLADEEAKQAATEASTASGAEPAQPAIALTDLMFNGRKLPKPTDNFELFSPPRAFDRGTETKSIYDALTDEGELKGVTIFLSPFDDMDWGNPFIKGFSFRFNADGSLASLSGPVASTQSPRIFREKLAQFCGGTVDQVKAEVIGSYMSGQIETRFAKCSYVSEDELRNGEVVILYKN